MPTTSSNTKKPKMASSESYCRKCTKIKSLKMNFYEATNPLLDSNGYMSVCKECINELYHHYFEIYGNLETALQMVCQDLDVRLSREALKQTQSHVEKLVSKGKKADAVFGYYKSKLTSTGKHNEGLDSFRYRDSDFTSEEDKAGYTIKLDTGEDGESDFELTKEMLDFWGRVSRFQKWHYEYLTNKYTEYINTYECETPAMEELMKQAAFESLEIQLKRMEGKDASKHLKNMQELLGSANIKPVQESGANATDQVAFGLLIKKWENEKPIPEPDEEWKDVDGIRKYIRVWFLGHLCKMLGINNEYSEEYEMEMARLRVEMPSDTVDLEELEEGE